MINEITEKLDVREEVKNFRIKTKAPSFDDLIDVAVNAVRNEIIQSFKFSKSLMERDLIFLIKHDGERVGFGYDQAQDGINYLESLATETFVIEDISCLLKINENIQSLVLANDCDVTDQIYFEDCGMHLKDGYGNSIVPNINILKGATVTQKRGK